MISSDILDDLRKNSQLYIKVGEGDYEPIGNCTNFELSCEAGSLPKINLELIQIPTPDNPIPVAEQTRIMDISDLVQYQPYEPVGKNLFNELKIDDSGITIRCEGLRTYDDTIDAMRYCVEDIEKTKCYEKYILGKKEGENMKILNMYVEKSQENIRNYYQNLIEMEEKNDIVTKEYDELINKFVEDMEKLAEKYNESNTPNGSYLTEDCGDYDFHYIVVHKNTEKEEMYYKLRDEELKQLREKIEEVQAQLEIITNDENSSYHDINYVLHNYGIIDDNGRLTTYTPTFVDKEAPAKEAPKKVGRPKKVSE